MIDFFGHLAYASIMVGMFLLARRNAYGWVARLLGDAGWVVLGFALGMSSIVLWGLTFIAVDIAGWRKWRKSRYSTSSDGYDLGRGVLYTKQIGYDAWVEVGTTQNLRINFTDNLDTELLREEL